MIAKLACAYDLALHLQAASGSELVRPVAGNPKDEISRIKATAQALRTLTIAQMFCICSG